MLHESHPCSSVHHQKWSIKRGSATRLRESFLNGNVSSYVTRGWRSSWSWLILGRQGTEGWVMIGQDLPQADSWTWIIISGRELVSPDYYIVNSTRLMRFILIKRKIMSSDWRYLTILHLFSAIKKSCFLDYLLPTCMVSSSLLLG